MTKARAQPTNPQELQAIVAKISGWVALHPIISRVTLFGSRVRGDYRESSDLDIYIDLDPVKAGTTGVADWTQLNSEDFSSLRALFSFCLDIVHGYPNGQTKGIINAGNPLPDFTNGKVVCVFTLQKQ